MSNPFTPPTTHYTQFISTILRPISEGPELQTVGSKKQCVKQGKIDIYKTCDENFLSKSKFSQELPFTELCHLI